MFSTTDITSIFARNYKLVTGMVDVIEENQFLHSSDDEIVEHIYSKLSYLPLKLHLPGTQERKEIKIGPKGGEQDGIQIVNTIKFTGSPGLWELRPTELSGSRPRGVVKIAGRNVEGGTLDLVFTKIIGNIKDPADLKKVRDRMIDTTEQYINWSTKDVESYNEKLRRIIRQSINGRRKRLSKHLEIEEAFDIPLKPKPGMPDFKELPVKRRIVEPLKTAPNLPKEPGISDENYELILNVIRLFGRSMEDTPRTFNIHPEEELRDFFLAALNILYGGAAAGERFRNTGKTDISIIDDEQRAFVAECKVWEGGKGLSDGLEQLLGYLTWRDCKTSIVIFNKDRAKFKEIQKKVPATLSGHDNHIKQLDIGSEGEWRFRFRSANDPDREITVHVYLFDLYVKPEDKDDSEVSG